MAVELWRQAIALAMIPNIAEVNKDGESLGYGKMERLEAGVIKAGLSRGK